MTNDEARKFFRYWHRAADEASKAFATHDISGMAKDMVELLKENTGRYLEKYGSDQLRGQDEAIEFPYADDLFARIPSP